MKPKKSIMQFIPKSPERVSMAQLARQAGTDERSIRAAVLAARKAGEVIAADKTGYFIPATDAEMREYYHARHKAALSTLASLKATRQKLKAVGVDVAKLEGRTNGKEKTSVQS